MKLAPVAAIVGLTFLIGCTGSYETQNAELATVKISRAQLEEMFDAMRGEPGWDLDSELAWDYFFTDRSDEKLMAAATELEARGYDTVGILRPDPDDENQETLFLQVRRIERHTVDSLYERNEVLYAFAEQLGLESYDGMDMSRPDRDDGRLTQP